MDIQLSGVCTHNIQNIDVRIPWGKITAVVGVSGSGKSSLAHDTLFVEGRLRYIETLSGRLQPGGKWVRPQLRWAENLSPTVAVGQKGASWADSTGIADALGVSHHMRYWFAHAAQVRCPDCGTTVEASDVSDVVQACMDLPEGEKIWILAPFSRSLDELRPELLESGFTRLWFAETKEDLDLEDGKTLPPGPFFVVVDRIVRRGTTSRIAGSVEQAFRMTGGRVCIRTQDGRLLHFSNHPRCACGREFARKTPRLFSRDPEHGGGCGTCAGQRTVGNAPCPDCAGTGYARELDSYFVDDLSWRQWMELTFAEAAGRAERCTQNADPAAQSLLAPVLRRMQLACELHLGEKKLVRSMNTLSRGEAQFVRLAAQLAGDLSGVTFVLDEPGQGLDPQKRRELLGLLRRLTERMNTVVIVEHDPDIVAACDYVIELGPQAGEQGGRLIFAGPPHEMARHPQSLMAPWVQRKATFPPPVRRGPPAGFLETPAVQLESLAYEAARFPLQRWSVITGETASGKTRFLEEILPSNFRLADAAGRGAARLFPGGVWRVQERSYPRTPHSHVASLCGVWDFLRKWYAQLPLAKARGYDAGRFSTSRAHEGRCLKCAGTGEILVETGGVSQVVLPCPACEGRRFSPATLEIRWRGYSIADLLDLSVSNALSLLASFPEPAHKLQLLVETGLGYLKLGQPARSLSGGEMQRLLLTQQLAVRQESCLLLDDPADGLHPEDAILLIRLFQRLADEGHTLITTDHTGFLGASSDACFHMVRDQNRVFFENRSIP